MCNKLSNVYINCLGKPQVWGMSLSPHLPAPSFFLLSLCFLMQLICLVKETETKVITQRRGHCSLSWPPKALKTTHFHKCARFVNSHSYYNFCLFASEFCHRIAKWFSLTSYALHLRKFCTRFNRFSRLSKPTSNSQGLFLKSTAIDLLWELKMACPMGKFHSECTQVKPGG